MITGDYRVGDVRHNWADITALLQLWPDWHPIRIDAGLESLVCWAQSQPVFDDHSKIATRELKARNL
jgi:dTDP-L-rhamnose 4-epimerase